jgi:endo-1,4-beta-xylanase
VQAQLLHDQCYTQTLAKQFNLVTPENEMKFESVRGSSRDAGYNFHSADVIVDFATKHGMNVRGHTLVYDDGLLPRWLGQLSEKERDETRTQHIRKMIVQYGDRVTYWDVVNEALGLTGDIKRSVWGDTDEYVVGSFRTAREALSIANSHALLFYNDWGLEYPGPKFEGAYRLVKRLSDERLVDGVGFQCHLDSSLLDIKTLRANMDRIARLGLQVQVTEIDVRLPRDEWSSRKALDLQRDIYQQVLSACLSVPIKSAAGMATGGCSAFIMWGFTDAHSWIDLMQKDPMFINQGAALIFDKYYEPKPAYYGLVQTLKAAGERQAQ